MFIVSLYLSRFLRWKGRTTHTYHYINFTWIFCFFHFSANTSITSLMPSFPQHLFLVVFTLFIPFLMFFLSWKRSVSDLCHFSSLWRDLFRISCRQVYWQQIPSIFFCLSKSFPSLLKDKFIGYRIVGWWFFFF